ncbi:thioredoxin [Planctomycetes bacterium TBK1r]|uniref:Thioredoxin n=1 Tax=Stieleria magnilauensis TaxID=2527963 RepID=A0ABX5XWK5_9BACT|nr:Thioredoxin [Planctomycetes bacterium TBK1r]
MSKLFSIAATSVILLALVWGCSPSRPLAHQGRQVNVPAALVEPVTIKAITTNHKSPVKPSNAGVLPLSEANFVDTVLNAGKPVLVDFYADWCGPCRMMAPVVEEIATSTNDQIMVGKLDVDANPAAAAHFKVKSLPTMLIFNNGEVVDRVIGVTSKDELMSRLQDVS